MRGITGSYNSPTFISFYSRYAYPDRCIPSKYFLPFCKWCPHSINSSFYGEKLLIWYNYTCQFFVIISCAIEVPLRKSLPMLISWSVCLIFLLVLRVSTLTLLSLVHFNWFLYRRSDTDLASFCYMWMSSFTITNFFFTITKYLTGFIFCV